MPPASESASGEERSGAGGQPLLLVSDFNLANLAGLLGNLPAGPRVLARLAPFGNVAQTLLGGGNGSSEGALVWTSPQAVIPSFQALLEHRSVPRDVIEREVDKFSDVLRQARPRFRFLLVPTWTPPSGHRGLGMLDFRSDAGMGRALLRMNLRLVENLEAEPGVFVLDGSRWTSRGTTPAEAMRLWYLGKIPFTVNVFREAARDVQAAVAGLAGRARKVAVVDLDNTLWGGVVGDVGWEGLRLGGHDAVGEAFVDFQRALKALTNRGVLLAIASKNQESVAMEALARHPEMALRPDDFAAWRIDWNDKAQNIVELARDLNLGLDSMVFLDDHPGERARVREALPEVLVPDWPEDPLQYAVALRALPCFDTPALSEEDLDRARMYTVERQRREDLSSVSSLDEWLRTLQIRVTVRPLRRADLPRAAQLLNKTNQMNLATRRMTESELWEWSSGSGRAVWTVRVGDRFGDYGLTGLMSVESDGSEARIADFLLSCRVFGRRVEETMVHLASSHARERGLTRIVAEFRETSKNKPCWEFWSERSGFEPAAPPHVFSFELSRDYPVPDCVELVLEEGADA